MVVSTPLSLQADGEPSQALNAAGNPVPISEAVQAGIASGEIVWDGQHLSKGGHWIDPQTGAAFPEATEVPQPAETVEPTEEPTTEPPEEPGETPAPTPTEEPTPEPTPSEEPTPEPTPTEEPTPTPTDEPTPTPTDEPTPTETPTVDPTETVVPDETIAPAEDPAETEIPVEQPAETATATPTPTLAAEDTTPKTNEDLIAQQHIVEAPVIIEDFRFWTVARKYAFPRMQLAIREEMDEESRIVGILPQNGLCYILKEEENGWYYVESGRVRGFVPSEWMQTGDDAQKILEDYQKEQLLLIRRTHNVALDLQVVAPTAEAQIEPEENAAFTYLRATAEQTVIRKDYALAANDTVIIKESPVLSARAVGRMRRGDLCYIVADRLKEWIYIESGDVRGFVRAEDLKMDAEAYVPSADETRAIGQMITSVEVVDEQADDIFAPKQSEEGDLFVTAEDLGVEKHEEPDLAALLETEPAIGTFPIHDAVEAAGEDHFNCAEKLVDPTENSACYYTLTSPLPGTPGGRVRDSLITFSSQFVGNPYVWGGTSLTNGADCSGFVQSVYAQYGYRLPRTSREQSQYGMQIPVEEAQPGDLIFYARDGVVHHVVIYAGEENGQMRTIEAKSTRAGIVNGYVNQREAVWATRVLEDTTTTSIGGDITEKNATPEMYGKDLGKFKITYYCACAKCCNVETGITATGAPVVQGRTIAVDPNVIPYGTQVIIGGHVFTAEDCGGAIKSNRIDIYVNEHETALQLGVDYAEVYLVK